MTKSISAENVSYSHLWVGTDIRKLAEYGFGEYGFKHRTQ